MDKKCFLEELRAGLQGLPQEELEERLSFYSEMIDDYMEDGLSEQDAVAAVGSADDIIFQTVNETPLHRLAVQKVRPKRKMHAWEILFLILGSPVWLSILIALGAVVLSVYISLWAVIISLYAAAISMIGIGVGALVPGIVYISGDKFALGIVMVGVSLVCTGLGMLLLVGTNQATRGVALLTRKLWHWSKARLIKEGAK